MHAFTLQDESYRLLKDGVMDIEAVAEIDLETSKVPPVSEFYVSSKTFYPFGSEEYPEEISLPQLENLLED